MENITELQYVIAPVLATLSAQAIKYYRSLGDDGLQVNDIWATGGMPSVHTAAMSSIVAMLLLNDRMNDPVFAVSFVLLGIIARDATGVRRTAGEVAQIIKSHPQFYKNRSLHIDLGHTPKQVALGMVWGAGVGILTYFALN